MGKRKECIAYILTDGKTDNMSFKSKLYITRREAERAKEWSWEKVIRVKLVEVKKIGKA